MPRINADTQAALAAFETLARRLVAELLARDPGAGRAVASALDKALDGRPGRRGPWFRLADPAVMARLVQAWERLRSAATVA